MISWISNRYSKPRTLEKWKERKKQYQTFLVSMSVDGVVSLRHAAYIITFHIMSHIEVSINGISFQCTSNTMNQCERETLFRNCKFTLKWITLMMIQRQRMWTRCYHTYYLSTNQLRGCIANSYEIICVSVCGRFFPSSSLFF